MIKKTTFEPLFRALNLDEIEIRPSAIYKDSAQFLLYKDARCDMQILDETVGPENWQRQHTFINGKEYCTVSIRNPETGEWIAKQDCGTESFTEKEKGQSSDAFKRACTNWGIGRELYTKLYIKIRNCTEPSGQNDRKGNPKYQLKSEYKRLTVTNLRVDNDKKKITGIGIANKKGKRVYAWMTEHEGGNGT